MTVAAIIFLASGGWIIARVMLAYPGAAHGIDILATGLATIVGGTVLAIHAL